MASRSKNKTTFAKLAREGRLRARRIEKQAKKAARKQAAENPATPPSDTLLAGNVSGGSASPVDDA